MARVATDVAVIGAGPAGSVFATRMAQLGFAVHLIERARFPRSRLGESLTPGVVPMLASMGSATVLATAGARRVDAVHTNWDGHEAVRHDPRAEGLLVDRGAFDAALVARAAEVGVTVLQPAHVRHRARTTDGWHLPVEAAGEMLDLDAAFLADATGRAGWLGGRRRAMGRRTLALHGYWTGASLPARPRIEAGPREWCWGVPIPDGRYNTLVFLDPGRLRAEPGTRLEDRLLGLLQHSALMRDVQGGTLAGPVRAADATPYVNDACVGARHICVGDAGLALDPLSSSGVQKAVQTALSGAIVANTLLRRPEAAESACAFYRDSLNGAATQHRTWAAGHYATAAVGRHDPFWTGRAGTGRAESELDAPTAAPTIADDAPVRLSADARWERVPCLGAQYVELRSALRHPRLDGPVAYLGGQDLAGLLRDVSPGVTSRQLAERWSSAMPLDAGLSIARWLAGRGVLEPYPVAHP